MVGTKKRHDFESKSAILKEIELHGEISIIRITERLDETIQNNFTAEDFRNIFNTTNKNHFKKINNKAYNVFFELIDNKRLVPFGIVWVTINHDIKKDLTIHGGAWKPAIGYAKYYIDSWITILCFLNNSFKTIRSSCLIHNRKAEVFLCKSGFQLIEENNIVKKFRFNKLEFDKFENKYKPIIASKTKPNL